jgi:hypothetical protein
MILPVLILLPWLPWAISHVPRGTVSSPALSSSQWPAGGDWVLRVDGAPATGEAPWRDEVTAVTLWNKHYGRLESAGHFARFTYADGRLKTGLLRKVEFRSTEFAPFVHNRTPSLRANIEFDVEIDSGVATLFATRFELRLPLAELTEYVNRQAGELDFRIAGWSLRGLRWRIVEPLLEFDGRTIKFQMDVKVTGTLRAGDGDAPVEAHAHIAGECKHSMNDADRAVDQLMRMDLRIETLRWKSLVVQGHPELETVLFAALRGSEPWAKLVFSQTVEFYPFRDADAPAKVLLERVTIHDFLVSQSGDFMLLQGSCTRTKGRSAKGQGG